MIHRVAFDTSTLIGAILKPGSNPHLALQRALRSCEIFSCYQLIAELDEVLSRPYFTQRLPRSELDGFIALVKRNSTLLEVDETHIARIEPPCRDRQDNFILALAVHSGAHAIVSSDRDLLVLNPWNGIPILTPARFLAESESEDRPENP